METALNKLERAQKEYADAKADADRLRQEYYDLWEQGTGHGTPTVRRAQDRSGQAELRAQQAKELLDKCIADYHSKYGAPMVSLTKSPVIRAH